MGDLDEFLAKTSVSSDEKKEVELFVRVMSKQELLYEFLYNIIKLSKKTKKPRQIIRDAMIETLKERILSFNSQNYKK